MTVPRVQEVTASPMSAEYAPRSRTHPPPTRSSPEPQLAPEPNIRSAATLDPCLDLTLTVTLTLDPNLAPASGCARLCIQHTGCAGVRYQWCPIG